MASASVERQGSARSWGPPESDVDVVVGNAKRGRGRDWTQVKGFLFDIDGTLTNTDPLHLVAIRDTFARAGASHVVVDEDFIRREISGVDNLDIANKWLTHLSAAEKDQWILEKEAYFREVARSQIKPVDGLADLLQWIKARDVKCAAVTNAPKKNAEMILSGLGLTDTFDAIVIGCDPTQCQHAKPHPEPYLKAMALLGLEPHECCAVEDSVTGATAAVASGAHTVGILTSQTEEKLAKVGVKQTIRDYVQLLGEIKESEVGENAASGGC